MWQIVEVATLQKSQSRGGCSLSEEKKEESWVVRLVKRARRARAQERGWWVGGVVRGLWDGVNKGSEPMGCGALRRRGKQARKERSVA